MRFGSYSSSSCGATMVWMMVHPVDRRHYHHSHVDTTTVIAAAAFVAEVVVVVVVVLSHIFLACM